MVETFGGRTPAPGTIEMLEELSRVRPLSSGEVRRLDKAIRSRRSADGDLQLKRWTAGDVRRLYRYLVRGKRPAQIGPMMGRTERAIWRKMYLLGWTVRSAGQGSIALPARK